jgi:NAD(P)H-dependent FMN reductase
VKWLRKKGLPHRSIEVTERSDFRSYGGARAQYHLRQMFVYLNMYPLNRPEVIIPNAADKFDSAGNLTDHHTREKIQELLKALAAWARQTRYEVVVGGKIS